MGFPLPRDCWLLVQETGEGAEAGKRIQKACRYDGNRFSEDYFSVLFQCEGKYIGSEQ